MLTLLHFIFTSPVLSWRHAYFLIEKTHEMGVVISAFFGYILQSVISTDEQLLGVVEFALFDILLTIHIKSPFVQFLEMRAADAESPAAFIEIPVKFRTFKNITPESDKFAVVHLFHMRRLELFGRGFEHAEYDLFSFLCTA